MKHRPLLDLRVVLPAIVGWGAALVLVAVPSAPLVVSVVAWSVAVVLVALAVLGRHSRPYEMLRAVLVGAAVCAAATAVVGSSIAAHQSARRPSEFVASRSVFVAPALVVVTQTVPRGAAHFDATLVEARGTRYSAPITVFDGAPEHRVEIGTTLRLGGSLLALPPESDSAFLLYARAPATVVEPPPWYLEWSNGLRAGFAWAALDLPGDGGTLLPGLAIGDTTAVSPSLSADMKTSSLSHLTAVSGANCAVVIALILLAGAALGLPRWLRIAAAVLTLVGFVVLVTPQPSVLRAAVMAAIVLVSLAAGRPVRGLSVVAAASIGLIVMDPWLARNYGFALSVLATAGLLVLTGPLASMLARWMPRWLALGVAVPLAAQLACQPVLILLTPSLPLYGVLANTLAEPASPAATVLGLAACVTLPFVPALGRLLAQLAWVPSAWIAAVARFFAGLPGARLPWPEGILGATLLAVVTVLALLAVLAPPLPLRGNRPARPGSLPRRTGLGGPPTLRLVATLAWVAVIVVTATVTGVSSIVARLGKPANWQYADCDIGQGDAMVVRSAGKIALMDTGPSPALLGTCLADLGIDHIDLLVLSHYDLDHVAGTPAVDGMVTRVIIGPSSGQRRDDQIVDGLLSGGAAVDRVSSGAAGTLGDLRWSVLWPPAVLGDIEPGNEASVTVLFEPGQGCVQDCLSSLFVGDLDQRAQDLMLAANPSLPTLDVIEVAHHGSADQSEALYQRASAAVGLIGVGRRNRYGHPTAHLLDILASVGTLATRTDTEGLILVAPGDRAGAVNVWMQHPGVGGGG